MRIKWDHSEQQKRNYATWWDTYLSDVRYGTLQLDNRAKSTGVLAELHRETTHNKNTDVAVKGHLPMRNKQQVRTIYADFKETTTFLLFR